jgi:orotidine-5'-phosphate decarboxylase
MESSYPKLEVIMPKKSPKPIIVALDVDTRKEALKYVKLLKNHVDIFKVGLQLFSREGFDVVDAIIDSKKRVFLDLKFHDIPNTVSHAIKSIVRPGIEFFTVHASGGREMLTSAVETLKEARAGNSKITARMLAVTVLTSLDDDDLREIGVNHSAAGQVLNLSRLAHESGVDGVVASPQEVGLLKKEHGDNLVFVTPGVRLEADATQDQKRVMTPQRAFEEGSDFLVMGRSLLDSQDPLGKIGGILKLKNL